MSRYGLKIAQLFGRKLPSFRTLEEARAHIFAIRDARLARMKELSGKTQQFAADGTPKSLKRMEAWYFQLYESDSFRTLGVSREEFEQCMAAYFCHVAVAHCPGAEWEVVEFAFEEGKYQIGVRKGLFSWRGSSFSEHYKRPSNARRTAIFREYKKYFDGE